MSFHHDLAGGAVAHALDDEAPSRSCSSLSAEGVAVCNGRSFGLGAVDTIHFIAVKEVLPYEGLLIGIEAADGHVEAAVLFVDVCKHAASLTGGRHRVQAKDFVNVVAIAEKFFAKSRHVGAYVKLLQSLIVAQGAILDIAVQIERVDGGRTQGIGKLAGTAIFQGLAAGSDDDRLQVGAFVKDAVADAIDLGGNGEPAELLAAAEGVVANHTQRTGQADMLQRQTVVESMVVDERHSLWQIDADQ